MSPVKLGAPLCRAGRIGLPLLSAAALLVAASPASAAPVTRRFTTSACDANWFTVPAGVTSVTATVQGGIGIRPGNGGEPGVGAKLTATIPVTPGARAAVCADQGGTWGGSSSYSPGKGGGFAAISFSGDIADPDLFAGGGGGAGGGPGAGDGGDAGLPGGSGEVGESGGSSGGGGGGTQAGPGAGGVNAAAPTGSGLPGVGHQGGSANAGPMGAGGGGGGGGGYFGGGGGSTGDTVAIGGAGGGGGSSFCDPALSCDSSLVSSASYVEISYAAPPAPTETTVTVAPAIPTAGQPIRYTATISPVPDGGTVAFAHAGYTIYDCESVPVVAGVATCDTQTPWEAGEQTVTATYSGAADYATSEGSARYDPLAGAVTVTPDPAGFGDVVVGESATREVTVANSGDADLVLSSTAVRVVDDHSASVRLAPRRAPERNTSDFAVASSACDDVVLAPGRSCTAQISFRPTVLGERVARLRVYGDYAGDADAVQLTGNGVEAPVVPQPREPEPAPPATPTPPAAPPVSAPAPSAPVAAPAGARGATLAPSADNRAAVKENGTFVLPVTCPNRQACRVDGTLTLAIAGGSKAARAAAAKTTVLVRFSGIRVAANKTKTLSLRLPAAFVKAQQAKGVRKLRTTLTIRTTLGDGRSVTTRQQLTLLIPRARVAQRRAAAPAPKPAQRPSFTG
ncbi:choice-of-anchor D domain-containing protein [Conexibacter sp. CPCC 206217]|uniref:choice-of-anchor D domain-containing protein n=1 Tax=Conexibacter sp. CPCC 206217 TaxID=3064574 RepID=UPI002725103B|nr:choice-of-anchor D domain-containing protein [Conexibacter sp. CPCC 206217]MDO8211184.1 choice-of-anchor D domain-containing protein [Conexibacter sp. CPCC 206217]